MTADGTHERVEVSRSWVRDLAPYIALTFGISWGAWAVELAIGGSMADPTVFVLYVVGACGPSLAALVLRLTGGPGVRQARLGALPRWLPAALLLGAAPAVIAALVVPVFGASAFDPEMAAGAVAASGGLLPFLGIFLIDGPLAEEFGWRGYAQPRLRRHLSPARTSLVLGTIWALWHVPLFLLVGTGQSAMGLFSVSALLFFLSVPVLSVGFWFVSERLHGGVPAAVLMHLAVNLSLTLLAATASVIGSLVVFVATALIAVVLLVATRAPREVQP